MRSKSCLEPWSLPLSASSPYSIRRDRRARLLHTATQLAYAPSSPGPRNGSPREPERARSRSSDLPVARAELRSIRHENTSRAGGVTLRSRSAALLVQSTWRTRRSVRKTTLEAAADRRGRVLRAGRPHSNAVRPITPIVEQKSAEPPALSGHRQDFRPCSTALSRPRVRWPCRRRSSSRACRRNSRRRHIWRVQMRDQRRRRVGTGHTGNVATAYTSRPFLSERFSPRAPAPAAPPLPAQYAIRRDRSDESALSPRRSTPPANPAPR